MLTNATYVDWRTRISRTPGWVVLLFCTLILALRRPDAFMRPQFWAEDALFYRGAFMRGMVTFAESYAGYFHTLPRIIALIAVHVDPLWAPRIFVCSAILGAVYVASRALSIRCALPQKLYAAIAVVLVPDTAEVLANVVNLQWVLVGGFLLLLIASDPFRPMQYAHDFLAALLLGLTGPFSIFLFPLFVDRAWHRRSVASWGLAAVVGVCGLVQAWTLFHSGGVAEGGRDDFIYLVRIAGMRITGSLLGGYFVSPDYSPFTEVILGVVALLAVPLLAIRKGEGKSARISLSIVFFLLLLATVYRGRRFLPALCHADFSSRYFYPLQLVVIWLLLSAVADVRRWIARGATVLLTWMVLVNVPRLRETPLVDMHWEQYAPKIRSGEAVLVPVNPDGWGFSLPKRER